mmetsp:Transcript_17358/g.50676  ORF Transcript_17358/g.50676 Transcript_17358/m.50676 type:complete len:208 (+) Transcript_17358:692-1315(+)
MSAPPGSVAPREAGPGPRVGSSLTATTSTGSSGDTRTAGSGGLSPLASCASKGAPLASCFFSSAPSSCTVSSSAILSAPACCGSSCSCLSVSSLAFRAGKISAAIHKSPLAPPVQHCTMMISVSSGSSLRRTAIAKSRKDSVGVVASSGTGLAGDASGRTSASTPVPFGTTAALVPMLRASRHSRNRTLFASTPSCRVAWAMTRSRV